MKICFVAAFPPSGRQLNEYSFHIAREIQRHPDVDLTILADELTDYDFATDEHGNALKARQQQERPGFKVIRCWRFGSVSTPLRLLRTIRRLQPDIVWFNLVFSSFGAPNSPFAAFAGLSAPALTRAAGFYTHITLHQVIDHVDFAAAGVRRERLFRLGTHLATRTLLQAHSVSVLLSAYRRTLMKRYAARNILLGTHGTFTTVSRPPDFTRRGNPDVRILAFGHWGTYKRLETLMAAFPAVHAKIPNARLIVAGGNHPAAAGYWESIREAQPRGLPIEFRGYIPQQDVPDLFRTSSVLVMPYNSATGSSGPAHQACEYGLPIVCADLPDFRCMAADDDMAISFFRPGDARDLADKLAGVLASPELERQMAEHNYQAGIQMTMASVVRNYLRWFALHRCKRELASGEAFPGADGLFRSWWANRRKAPPAWTLDEDLLPGKIADFVQSEEEEREISAEPPLLRRKRPVINPAENDGYADAG